MSIFRGRKVTQRGGANAGRGDDPHGVTLGAVRNLRYSAPAPSSEDTGSDDAPAGGIVRPQIPGFYDWAKDPEMNPDHILNQ